MLSHGLLLGDACGRVPGIASRVESQLPSFFGHSLPGSHKTSRTWRHQHQDAQLCHAHLLLRIDPARPFTASWGRKSMSNQQLCLECRRWQHRAGRAVRCFTKMTFQRKPDFAQYAIESYFSLLTVSPLSWLMDRPRTIHSIVLTSHNLRLQSSLQLGMDRELSNQAASAVVPPVVKRIQRNAGGESLIASFIVRATWCRTECVRRICGSW
jgi:hypothetical protein